MRLIDADKLFPDRITKKGVAVSQSQIANAPTVEERKQGEWIDGHCSNCGCDIPAYIDDWKWEKDMDAKFCPSCGADMRGNKNG